MATETVESLELTLFTEAQSSIVVFTGGGMNAVLDQIEAKVREAAAGLDISTADGRDKIRSVAYKVAKTKTALDAEGKRLTEEWRKNTAKVNEERKKSTARLEALADEVRAPLTEFEEKEKRRVAGHEEALRELGGLLPMIAPGGILENATAAALGEHLVDFSTVHVGRDWEEFEGRAQTLRRQVYVAMIGKIESRKKYEAEQAELARLRQEEAARLQRERDEAIARAAAEQAQIKAELKAKEEAEAERQRVEAAAAAERRRVAAEAERVRQETERQQREAEEKAAAERQAIEDKRLAEERARLAAEARIAQAEEDRLLAEARAEGERVAAEQRLEAAKKKAAEDAKKASEKAKKDREAALQAERERVTREQMQADIDRNLREADEANKARVRAEIVSDLLPAVNDPNEVEAVADLIMAGKIRNLKVIY